MSESANARVIYRPISDASCGYYLEKAESILNDESTKNFKDINDILEIYNITKFFKVKEIVGRWSLEEKIKYKKKLDVVNQN